VPAGEVTVTAVRGLATPPAAARATVAAGETREVTLELAPVWDARAAGWYSGDHHFHLNYGGPFALRPDDLLPLLAGEDLDVATPMLANLHTRFEDQALWGWRRVDRPPFVAFAQEVRSHFLGHVGLIGTRELVWPWIWGPGYEVYGRDDRTNAAALAAARRQGGLGIYVHPVTRPDPFASDAGLASIPLEYAADVAHGAVDLIEVACLWSDELGTSDLWYRALNLGVPIAPEAGTDAMTDFGRTMAVGTTRVYVRPDGPFTYERYLAALKAGRSFVTTGPMLDFRVRDARPGDVLPRGGAAPFTLELHTAQPVERVEVLVNGGAGVARRGGRQRRLAPVRRDGDAPRRRVDRRPRRRPGDDALAGDGQLRLRAHGAGVDRAGGEHRRRGCAGRRARPATRARRRGAAARRGVRGDGDPGAARALRRGPPVPRGARRDGARRARGAVGTGGVPRRRQGDRRARSYHSPQSAATVTPSPQPPTASVIQCRWT
jgi:hypothetical protein